MYDLKVYVNKVWESRGVYDTYEEAFRAGMRGKGYCEFRIEEVL